MAAPEDARAAANIFASLSSYVITASLGVIAAQAAVAVFVLDKKEQLFWFDLSAILSVLASVASIVCGGRGISDIAEEGFNGTWTLKLKHDFFNYQAIFALLGIVLLVGSLFCGSSKPENPKQLEEIQQLKTNMSKLQNDLASIQAKVPQNCPNAANDKVKKKHSAH
jgi:hypothetical protein